MIRLLVINAGPGRFSFYGDKIPDAEVAINVRLL
jgi:hypothetical protein